eukprot:1872982-Pleurochrysis_carterae.AAC.1
MPSSERSETPRGARPSSPPPYATLRSRHSAASSTPLRKQQSSREDCPLREPSPPSSQEPSQ